MSQNTSMAERLVLKHLDEAKLILIKSDSVFRPNIKWLIYVYGKCIWNHAYGKSCHLMKPRYNSQKNIRNQTGKCKVILLSENFCYVWGICSVVSQMQWDDYSDRRHHFLHPPLAMFIFRNLKWNSCE